MSIILDSVIHPAVTLCFAYIVIAFCIHAMHWSDRYINPAPESTTALVSTLNECTGYRVTVADARWFMQERLVSGEWVNRHEIFPIEGLSDDGLAYPGVGA